MLGQKIVALIETAAPVCVERFVDYPQLGRFTLRDEGMCLLLCMDNANPIMHLQAGQWLLARYMMNFISGYWLKSFQITRLVDKNLEDLTDGVKDLSVGA